MAQVSLKDRKVLVTGGAGVIGRELLTRLIKKSAKILSLDRYPLPEENEDGVFHIQRDLAADGLNEVCDFQPQIVFHLAAAFERSEESSEFWSINWRDNVMLSHRIVELIKDMPDLEVFVFASSYLIYLPSLYLSTSLRDEAVCLQEDDLIAPRNLCGAAKYYTEREINFVRDTLNPSLRTVHARIFRVYGCDSRDVISRWVRAALSGQEMEVYNRQNRFDFIFAGDVAEGLLRLAESPDASGPVNLGSGVARSIQDVLISVAKYVSPAKSRVKDLGTREYFEVSCANLARLKQLTGWVPAVDLKKGIEIIVEFEKRRARQETAYE